MSKTTYHLLFEQSGTFKNVLKHKGFNAYDYDLLNDYRQTDYQVDLFKQIEEEYDNLVYDKNYKTIFTNMNPEKDFIIAFFPCTHFSGLNQFQYKLLIAGKKRELNEKAIKRIVARNKERAYFFEIYMKFCFLVTELKIPTIIENPASCSGNHSYLELFSPIPIAYKEIDRTKFGDLYRKPTIFFAINFEMKENFIMFSPRGESKRILEDAQGMTERSMITQEYAENFYKRFLEGHHG